MYMFMHIHNKHRNIHITGVLQRMGPLAGHGLLRGLRHSESLSLSPSLQRFLPGMHKYRNSNTTTINTEKQNK